MMFHLKTGLQFIVDLFYLIIDLYHLHRTLWDHAVYFLLDVRPQEIDRGRERQREINWKIERES
jgi:hypothetical protein